jgi:hypothetical protein
MGHRTRGGGPDRGIRDRRPRCRPFRAPPGESPEHGQGEQRRPPGAAPRRPGTGRRGEPPRGLGCAGRRSGSRGRSGPRSGPGRSRVARRLGGLERTDGYSRAPGHASARRCVARAGDRPVRPSGAHVRARDRPSTGDRTRSMRLRAVLDADHTRACGFPGRHFVARDKPSPARVRATGHSASGVRSDRTAPVDGSTSCRCTAGCACARRATRFGSARRPAGAGCARASLPGSANRAAPGGEARPLDSGGGSGAGHGPHTAHSPHRPLG